MAEKSIIKNKKITKSDNSAKSLPKVGDLVNGRVIEIGRNEIYVDLDGIATGLIRGPEAEDELGQYSNLKKGDEITGTVIDIDNEKGLFELSLRQAGHLRAWQKLNQLMEKKEIISVKVVDANSGGLIIQYGKIIGFIPTSQLSPEHYPRVKDAEKTKILELLKKFIGQTLKVQIISVDETEKKLICSERNITASSGDQKVGRKFNIGDIVEGEICGLVDFGAFLKFDNQEGLIHISEIGWRRLDHPSDMLKVGDKVKAQIIGIEDNKYSLSIKKLIPDPWKEIHKKYKVGQEVKGKILKINPFGFFVELDPEIHGLAHISEISDRPIKNLEEIAKVGDILKFKITSIEPEDHRLGLSLKETNGTQSKRNRAKDQKNNKK